VFDSFSDEPEAPRNLLVKDYWTDNITIVWDAPNNDGGSPLTGYLVEKRDVARHAFPPTIYLFCRNI